MNKKRTPKHEKQWSSSAARQLFKLAGQASTIEDAVRIVVTQCLVGVGCPPTDLEAAAQRISVKAIVGEDLPVSGELRRDAEGLRVVYSNHLSQNRRRFTIAHELGHAIFERSNGRPQRSGTELERLCDMLAAEILMPQEVFSSLATGAPSLPQLLQLAETFRVSISAASLRYAKMKKVSIFYLHDDNILWGCGVVKKSTLNSLDYGLRMAITDSMNGASMSQPLLLDKPEWCGEWRLDCKPFSGGRALFMLRPTKANQPLGVR